MNDSSRPMRDVRGTIILADYVHPMIGGKWAIAGTFTNWRANPGETVAQLPKLNIYTRFQVEQAGEFEMEILLVHKAMSSHEEALIRQDFRAAVADPNQPVELACFLPPIAVACPNVAPELRQQPIGVPLLLWLKVNDCDVATCPLSIIFPPTTGLNQGETDGDPSRPRLEADEP